MFDPARALAINGVVAHQLRAPGASRVWGRLRLTSPALTWCLLATQLGVPDLVAAGDFLLTGDRPLVAIDELSAAVTAWFKRPGAAKLVRAFPQLRAGPLSRPETHARLLFAAAGLPEPELNGKIYDTRGRFLSMSDLVWRANRVAWEYEGNHHWADAQQFRRDILRRERVEDADWRLSRFTADDIRLRPGETVTRLAQKLALPVSRSGLAAAQAFSRSLEL